MFGKTNINNEKIDTLIGEGTKLQGKVEGKGSIKIDGTIEGDIILNGNIILGEKGNINGNVICDNIYISGKINGNISCKEQLRITNTGKLFGDIEVNNFVVDENAIFEGNCKMNNNSVNRNKDEKVKQEKSK